MTAQKENRAAEPLAPGLLNEFAELLHDRRSQISRPAGNPSCSGYDLWTILHEREVSEIDAALSRIRAGCYGLCLGCGGPIPILHLFLIPTSECCLDCRPKTRTSRYA